MICLACSAMCGAALCARCVDSMRAAPDRLLPCGVVASAGFSHEGAARHLVHRLKYRPCAGIAEILAAAMAPHADGVDALVPVPRAPLRRWLGGTDPAHALAVALGRHLGIPVVLALSAPMWWPRHAGRAGDARRPVAFAGSGVILRPGAAVALVDDVLTTGVTLQSAATALPCPPRRAIVATAAGRVLLG